MGSKKEESQRTSLAFSFLTYGILGSYAVLWYDELDF